MAELRTTCIRCLNSFDLYEYPSGINCPKCELHNEMLPAGLPKEGPGVLILGDFMFENSDWADNVLCPVDTIHEPHTWEVPKDNEEGEHRAVCRGKRLDTSIETTQFILLTKQDGVVRVAGISSDLEALTQQYVQWHDLGRNLLLLTITQPHEGLTGVDLAQLIPTHEFHQTSQESDQAPPKPPVEIYPGMTIEEE